MYAKAGNLKCAFSAFNQIQKKNIVHWTTMICGLAMHGHAEGAISLLQKMRKSDLNPNEITFTTIFNACCHSGLTDQAQKFLAIMVQELGFKPRLHHYGCLINLFAKAGRLDETYGVIKCLDVEPSIVIWTSFMEACRKFKKFEMAKEGIEKALNMARPDQNGGVCTLVSDLLH
jgi:pentatricopeptide repeat protein